MRWNGFPLLEQYPVFVWSSSYPVEGGLRLGFRTGKATEPRLTCLVSGSSLAVMVTLPGSCLPLERPLACHVQLVAVTIDLPQSAQQKGL